MDIKELYKENMSFDDFEGVINKVIQSSQDKIRTEYSAKIKELQSKIPKEKSEQELKIEEMNKQLEQKQKEIEQKEIRLNLTSKLVEKGLPTQLSDILNVNSVDDIDNVIDNLSEVFNNYKIDNSYKPNGHKNKNEGITKEQFKKMGYLEKLKLQETNKNLFDKLNN